MHNYESLVNGNVTHLFRQNDMIISDKNYKIKQKK